MCPYGFCNWWCYISMLRRQSLHSSCYTTFQSKIILHGLYSSPKWVCHKLCSIQSRQVCTHACHSTTSIFAVQRIHCCECVFKQGSRIICQGKDLREDQALPELTEHRSVQIWRHAGAPAQAPTKCTGTDINIKTRGPAFTNFPRFPYINIVETQSQGESQESSCRHI